MKKLVVTFICLGIFVGALGVFLTERNFEPAAVPGGSGHIAAVEQAPAETVLGLYQE